MRQDFLWILVRSFIKYQRSGYYTHGLVMKSVTLGIFSVQIQSSRFNRRETSKMFNYVSINILP